MEKQEFKKLLKSFELKELFNELGWDNFNINHNIKINENTLKLEGIAQKRDFGIFYCEADDEKISNRNTRRQISRKLSKIHFEHIVIYSDKNKTKQIWQIPIRKAGKPEKISEIIYYMHQDVEILFQKLRGLLFTIDEEEKITLIDVIKRVEKSFSTNMESITKHFYDSFKKERIKFLEFVEGIDDSIPNEDNKNKQWYVSVLLNRLMFCYFIQKKGYLDQNFNYLQNKLEESKKAEKDKYYGFYKDFLKALFFEGLGKPKEKRNTSIKLGRIPYLNGGIFDFHQIEKDFKEIKIKDEAFESIFNFF